MKCSDLFTQSVPKPPPASKYSGEHALRFVRLCAKNRTLRHSVEAMRREATRDGGRDFASRDGVFRLAEYVEVWADGSNQPTLRDDAEFHGGKRWSYKVETVVHRIVFDALCAWGALRDPWQSESETLATAAQIWPSRAEFVSIARELYNDGARGERLVTHPAWTWLGLSRNDVHYFYCLAHQFRELTYEACGSLVSIDFPKPE